MTRGSAPSLRPARCSLPCCVLALAGRARAAPSSSPTSARTRSRYDNFAWRVYKSPHFEVYYYPEFEQHLARVVSYAESAYQKVSSDLKHEIELPDPAHPLQDPLRVRADEPLPRLRARGRAGLRGAGARTAWCCPSTSRPDKLQGLITHELTHVFEFDLIPRSLVQRNVPLWVDEGLADYMRGIWDPLDLMIDPRRRGHRPDPAALAASRTTAASQPAPGLQPRPRRLRVHRGPLRQGGHPAVPLHLPQEHRGRRHGGHLPAGLPHQARGVRRGLREVAEGALQALPRQAAAERLRQGPLARLGEDALHPGLRLQPQPLGRDRWPPSPATARRARPTSSCSPPRTARCIQQPDQGLHRRVREHHLQRRLRGRPLHRLRPRAATPSPSSPARASGAACTWSRCSTGEILQRVPIDAGPGAGALPAARRPPRAVRRPQGRRLRHLPARPRDGRRTKNLTAGRLLRHRPPGLARTASWSSTRGASAATTRSTSFPLADPSRKTQLTFGAHDDTAPTFSRRRQRASTTPPPRTTTSTTCAAST